MKRALKRLSARLVCPYAVIVLFLRITLLDLFGSFCAAKKSKLPLVRELFHCFAGFCGFVLLATIEPSFVLCHFGFLLAFLFYSLPLLGRT